MLDYPDEKEARQGLDMLAKQLRSLPMNSGNYGLIHYDFQLDNVFYKKEHRSFQVIDFDDAMYHWYACDVVTALDDFLNEPIDLNRSEVQAFLNGYRAIATLSDQAIRQFSCFKDSLSCISFLNYYERSKV
ncbi:phosphotransferase enzyme family protein [Paenibacillus hunanensis]|uniref:phosphotransferase enzyme family protein n=1 Tax=Paenibacillus hunanensis TaxID=539262 RepID=UPI00227A2779|nr:phosphotransferase [Paenibacillus hunanensis]